MHSAKGVHPSCRGASAIHGFAAEAGEFTRRAGEPRQLTGLRLKRRRPRILLGSFGSSSDCKCNAGVHRFNPERFGKSRRCRGTLGSTHVARGRSRPAGLRPKHGGLHILPGGIGQLTVLQLRGYCRTSIWCRPFARRAVDWPIIQAKSKPHKDKASFGLRASQQQARWSMLVPTRLAPSFLHRSHRCAPARRAKSSVSAPSRPSPAG